MHFLKIKYLFFLILMLFTEIVFAQQEIKATPNDTSTVIEYNEEEVSSFDDDDINTIPDIEETDNNNDVEEENKINEFRYDKIKTIEKQNYKILPKKISLHDSIITSLKNKKDYYQYELIEDALKKRDSIRISKAKKLHEYKQDNKQDNQDNNDSNSSEPKIDFNKLIKWLIVFLCAVVLSLALHYYFTNLNRAKKLTINAKNNMESLTDEELVQEEVDLNNLISAAENNNDWRLATRFRYLEILKKLNHFKQIEFEANKTNMDYYFEINDDKLRNDFPKVLSPYEYIWYGKYEIDENKYQTLKEIYNNFSNKISNAA